ncbi:MAG: hypothetical protein DJ555_03810 [Desulfurococcaceae archaeon]|nr:MAG: hypothetical protein DJ555_03810 [Desulfurococcaceae archaeon]
MEEDLVALIQDDFSTLPVIEISMGRWHSYFARAVKRLGGVTIDLYRSGELVGQSVVYRLDLGSRVLGVIYYIAILPRYRGRGYGRVLLASAEEVLSMRGVDYFVATISGDNSPSIALFQSMGYSVYSWGEVSKVCGYRAMETLRMETCGYEDDLVAIKRDSGRASLEEVCSADGKKARKWWKEACLKPWLIIRGTAMAGDQS